MPDDETETTKSIDELLADARAESEAESAAEATLTEEAPPEPKRKRSSRPRSSGGRKRNLTEPLTDFYATLGMGVFMLNQDDGQVIIANAESMAASLVKWGDSDPRIYRMLERLTTTSAIGGVIAAHAPVILAIVSNHDLMPKLGGKNADKNQNDSTEPVNPFGASGRPTPNAGNGAVGEAAKLTPVVVETRGAR